MSISENLRERAIDILNSEPLHSKNSTDQLIEELLVHQVELEMQNINLIHAQNDLEESNKKYSDLYDLAPFGYFSVNKKGMIVEVNKTGEDLLLLQKAKIINRLFSRYVSPDSQYTFSTFLSQAINNGTRQVCEVRLVKRGGTVFSAKLESRIIPTIYEDNKQLLIVVTNINDFTLAGNPVDQTFEFSSAMIHELNQPLGVISNYLYGCIRRLESGVFDSKALIMALKNATQQLNRISDLTLKMKKIQVGDLNFEMVCIDSLINDSVELIKSELYDFTAVIHVKPYKNIPKAMIDKKHIQLVILNLGRNAIEAMRDAKTADPCLTIEINLISKVQAEILILDNGPGYPKDCSHRLFEANFTTKPYGTGLGLAVSRSIVKSHGGTIEHELNITAGACFKFSIPIVRT